jgi:hypothetical protein
MSMPMPDVHVRVNVHFHFYFLFIFMFRFMHFQLLTPLYTYTKNSHYSDTVCQLMPAHQDKPVILLWRCWNFFMPLFWWFPLIFKNNLADSIFFLTVPLNRWFARVPQKHLLSRSTCSPGGIGSGECSYILVYMYLGSLLIVRLFSY